MKKLNKRWKIILYGCSGLGVNMLNMIVGSYLCSALLIGGFDKHIEQWTYLNRDLVIAGLWGTLIFAVKVFDGFIDIPLSNFTDNLRTRFGRRRPAIIIGFIPMIIGYLRMLRRAIRRPQDAESPVRIARCQEMLTKLLGKIDSLTF